MKDFVHLVISLAFILGSYFLINRKVDYQFIDEIFHIPQAQQYCNSNFSHWDPKITTPPGLYSLSYVFKQIGSLVFQREITCDLATLRVFNAVSSLVLLAVIQLSQSTNKNISSGSILLFPLLTPYFNLFYTDTWSTVFIVASFCICLQNNSPLNSKKTLFSSFAASFLVFISLWFRQTNIVWSMMNLMILLKPGNNLIDFIKKVLFNLKTFVPVILPFAVNVLLFGAFVVYNGGITFGDKENHVSTFHVPQVFYCSFFMMLFGWPVMITTKSISRYLRNCYANVRGLLITLLSYIIIAVCIHKFTVIHPFLLADNRHYTFYLWRKVINRTWYTRYLMTPVYHFCAYQIVISLLDSVDLLTILSMAFCTCATLIPSPLFEPRYYILPYVYWRMLVRKTSVNLWLESVWLLLVNALFLTVFLNFEFNWDTEAYPQRIIW